MTYGLHAENGKVLVKVFMFDEDAGREAHYTREAETWMTPREARQMAENLKSWAGVAERQQQKEEEKECQTTEM